MKRALCTIVFAWGAFPLGAAFAQTPGVVAGTVLTASGGGVPIPKASIHAKNAASGMTYSATSAENGNYSISGLPPGNYEISAEAPPIFIAFSRKDVQVSAGQTVRLEIQMDDVLLNTLGDGGAEFVKLMHPQPAPKGPAPRTRDGRPDLSGVYLGAFPNEAGKPEPLPWAEELAKERQKKQDIPSSKCLPFGVTFTALFGPTKFVQTPTLLLILDEGEPTRQVFLDGRSHPKDLNPSFMGHSIGHWEKDTLVVDTVGVNDTWINFDGLPQTEKTHLTERYRRVDLGHLEVEITVEDSSAYKKPWTMKRVNSLAPKDVDILEYICEENERDQRHLKDN